VIIPHIGARQKHSSSMNYNANKMETLFKENKCKKIGHEKIGCLEKTRPMPKKKTKKKKNKSNS